MISAVAKRILPLRPSASTVERVFSAMGLLHWNPIRRNRLQPEVVKRSLNVYLNSDNVAAKLVTSPQTGNMQKKSCSIHY